MVINGTTYDYPETDDVEWGPEATDWAAAVTTGMLQKAGGLFQLLAEVDFGTSYGIKSLYYKTRTSNPASAGQFRLARADVVSWRNQANDANLDLAVNSSNVLTFNGTAIQNALSVTDTATIDLTFTSDTLSADVKSLSITNALVSNSAAIAYSKLNLSASIVNADVNSSAAIAYSKLALTGSIVNADINSSAAIAQSKLSLSITNAEVNASAAIAYSKLNLSGSIVNADVNAAAAIAYSKLNLSASIVNADVSASAAIAYSKLALTGSIVNADISASAAIAFSKLASLTSAHILIGSAGNVATDTAVTGDVTISNAGVTAVGTNKITNAMLAQVATATFKGRTTASTGNVEDLTATQATALLNTMVGDSGSGGTKGLAPAPAAGDAAAGKFLKADGTWVAPAGAGDVVGPGSSTNNGFVKFNGTTGKLIKDSAATISNSDVDAAAAIAFSKLASLTSAHILVGSAGNVATDTAVTGDVTISNAGVTAIGSGKVTNAMIVAAAGIPYSKLTLTTSIVDGDIAAAAAIARSKLAAGTADHVVINAASTGVFSSEAQLAKTRGGTGISSTATFPASGTVAITEALVSKTAALDLQIGQIAFPATQNPSANANTLDDYEEGTFTPTYFGSSTAGSTTYTTQEGYYTKIGDIVYFSFRVAWSGATGTGSARFGGLPFTISSTFTSAQGCAAVQFADNYAVTASGQSYTAFPISNTTTLTAYSYPSGGGSATAWPIDTAATVNISGFYKV